MNYNNYIEAISQRFSKIEEVKINSLSVKSMYEEKFEIKWMATKLKNFSFVAYTSKIDADDIITYSSACLDYALKSYKGLPRGLQNGVSAFNVLVSEKVTEKAKATAMARPKKHFAAFQMPVIVDLSNENIYYYKNTPIWGRVYYKYFREFIEMHFNIYKGQ